MRQCSALRVSTGRMPRLYCCCCWAGRVMLLSQVVAAGLGETLAASWRRANPAVQPCGRWAGYYLDKNQ